jgi:hypothetical protein
MVVCCVCFVCMLCDEICVVDVENSCRRKERAVEMLRSLEDGEEELFLNIVLLQMVKTSCHAKVEE